MFKSIFHVNNISTCNNSYIISLQKHMLTVAVHLLLYIFSLQKLMLTFECMAYSSYEEKSSGIVQKLASIMHYNLWRVI